ncbi:MAG: hypothetical protein RL158_276 [Bacteroidota bacterium]|jgi:hypothetical protein
MRACTAITKKGKPCSCKVEDWRIQELCHIHDPEGVFSQQITNGTSRRMRKKTSGDCSHKWYMRDPGIQCVKCFIVWDISMEKEIEDL